MKAGCDLNGDGDFRQNLLSAKPDYSAMPDSHRESDERLTRRHPRFAPQFVFEFPFEFPSPV